MVHSWSIYLHTTEPKSSTKAISHNETEKPIFITLGIYTHDIAYATIPEYQSEDAMKFVMG